MTLWKIRASKTRHVLRIAEVIGLAILVQVWDGVGRTPAVSAGWVRGRACADEDCSRRVMLVQGAAGRHPGLCGAQRLWRRLVKLLPGCPHTLLSHTRMTCPFPWRPPTFHPPSAHCRPPPTVTPFPRRRVLSSFRGQPAAACPRTRTGGRAMACGESCGSPALPAKRRRDPRRRGAPGALISRAAASCAPAGGAGVSRGSPTPRKAAAAQRAQALTTATLVPLVPPPASRAARRAPTTTSRRSSCRQATTP